MKNECRLIAGLLLLFSLTGVVYAASGEVFSGMRRGPQAGPTVITSDRLEFDYKDFIARFEDNVVVTDPEFVLEANVMVVYFENTNEIQRVIAAGKVFLKSGDMTAVCGKATYTRATGQVLIEDDIPVVTKGENRITGEKMSIWLKEQRVVVQSGVRLETQPEAVKKIKE